MLANRLFNNLHRYYNQNYSKYNLTNPLYYLNTSGPTQQITWGNYSKEVFSNYPDYFDWVINNNQYTFAVGDEALVQVFYECSDDHLLRASLGFLPSTTLPEYEYFRFDLDYDAGRDYYHNSSHIHFGYLNTEMRLSLYEYPWPTQFLNFVMFILKKKSIKKFKKTEFFPDIDNISNPEKYNHFFKLYS